MQEALKTFKSILRKNNDHVTHARQRVFATLYGKGPQSMSELHKMLGCEINRTSIYRVVELFEQRGIVRRIQIGWKYKVELSEVFVAHHHHISCLSCGRVFAIKEDERIELLIAEIARKNHISHPVHQLEIQGYCRQCAGKLS